MRLGVSDANATKGRVMPLYITVETNRGQDIAAPIGLSVGPGGQGEDGFSGHFRGLIPGVLTEPSLTVWREQVFDLVHVEIQVKPGLHSAGSDVDSRRGVQVPAIKLGAQLIDGKIRSPPASVDGDRVHHQVRDGHSIEPRGPINVKGLELRPPGPGRISQGRRIGGRAGQVARKLKSVQPAPAGPWTGDGPLPVGLD